MRVYHVKRVFCTRFFLNHKHYYGFETTSEPSIERLVFDSQVIIYKTYWLASSVPSIVPIWILNNSFKTLTLLRCSIFVHIKVCNVIQEPKITRSWPITKKIPKISQPFLIFIRVEYRFESLDLFFSGDGFSNKWD